MSKHETPPFRMIVQRGKLVPATAYDAERLDTWRNGAEVNVRFVEDRSRWGIRKWYAVINRAVKECSTPWKTAKEASEAIKLALGIVNLTKTVGGEFLAYPKSLTELDDPELEEAVEQMLAVIFSVTGVEPDEWRKQLAAIGEHEQETPDAPLSSGEGTSEPTAQAQLGGADLSADEADSDEAGEHEEQEEPGSPPASSLDPVKRMLCEECIDNMLRDAMSEPASERPAKVDKLRDVFLEPQNLGDFADFVNRCHETARRIIGKPSEKDRAREYLIGKVPS